MRFCNKIDCIELHLHLKSRKKNFWNKSFLFDLYYGCVNLDYKCVWYRTTPSQNIIVKFYWYICISINKTQLLLFYFYSISLQELVICILLLLLHVRKFNNEILNIKLHCFHQEMNHSMITLAVDFIICLWVPIMPLLLNVMS